MLGLTALKDIRRIYAGLNADEIRGAAYHDLKVGLMAASEEGYTEMERFLAPLWLDVEARADALRCVRRVNGTAANHFDFVICTDGVPLPHNG